MYKIVRKKDLNASVCLLEIEAPFVARKAKAGQFIIFRIDEMGERVPLTIAGYDREKGTVTIIFQKVGFSTIALGNLNEGDYIRDFVGPLGKPTHTEGVKRAAVIGGGQAGQTVRVPVCGLYGIGRGFLGLKRRSLLGMYATMEDARKELAAIAEQSGERASYQLRYACKMDGVRIAEE